MDTWIISDNMGEYVEYYNPTGHVMVFGKDRDKARRTTDSMEAFSIAKIAQNLYGRKQMKISLHH